MASLFQKLQQRAAGNGLQAGSKEAMDWYRSQVQNMSNKDKKEILADRSVGKSVSDPVIGSMVMFFYDPKHKDTLPYYDTFPLSIIVGPAPGGFYGINLHYLHPTLRAKLLDELLNTAASNRTESTKMKINYEKLKSMSSLKLFKPCFKHYLGNHVQTNIRVVHPDYWEIAAMLPMQKFRKKNVSSVWADSKEMI